jgi:hypothetical protein
MRNARIAGIAGLFADAKQMGRRRWSDGPFHCGTGIALAAQPSADTRFVRRENLREAVFL